MLCSDMLGDAWQQGRLLWLVGAGNFFSGAGWKEATERPLQAGHMRTFTDFAKPLTASLRFAARVLAFLGARGLRQLGGVWPSHSRTSGNGRAFFSCSGSMWHVSLDAAPKNEA